MATPSLRSPLGRVRGLGSSRSGTHHWWMQRVTSITLLPLTIWLVFALASLAGAGYSEVQAWVARPLNAVLLLAFLAAGFHHTAAGWQVILEDYVKPERRRLIVVLLVNGLCALAWLATSFAVLRVALR
ncbi:MAG: succinate dehydrogenase, hydrophobic membrane anchor protein [Pseudomonadota bacterium]